MAQATRRLGIALLVCTAVLRSERLPVQAFTTADGLLEDGGVLDILPDSHGFLWFATKNGLSRFDGQTFRTYGTREGFRVVNSIAEVSPNDYWISGVMGLAHYVPTAPEGKRFPVVTVDPAFPRDEAYQSTGDGQGGIWVAFGDGLYHGTPSPRGLEFQLVVRPRREEGLVGGSTPIKHVFRDSAGNIWAGCVYCGVYRVAPGGRIDHFAEREGLPATSWGPFLEDRNGQLWLGTPSGLLLLDRQANPEHSTPGHSLVRRRIETRFGTLENVLYQLCEAPDGHIWMASASGLLEWDGAQLRRYTRSNGLSDSRLVSVRVDRHGNLWVGTMGAGVMRIRRDGFLSFEAADGVPEEDIRGLLSAVPGETVAVTGFPDSIRFHELVASRPGERFRTIEPRFPSGTRPGWGLGQVMLRDHAGETWVATLQGLARFPATATLAQLNGRLPTRIYTVRDGLPGDTVRSIVEDAHGDVWIGSAAAPLAGVSRWVRSQDRIENLSRAPGMFPGRAPACFALTAAGTLWMGFPPGLVRFRQGKFEPYPSAANLLPAGTIQTLFVDAKGNLWGAGNEGGIFKVEEPDSDHPRFSRVGAEQGLSSNDANCVTADREGHIYAGTLAGVDRLDPDNGQVRHFTTADGLAGNVVTACRSDASGNLWFGTSKGLSLLRLDGHAGGAPIAATRITAVQFADRSLAISDMGETAYAGPTLKAGENHLQISFAAADTEGSLRYRYMLEGADLEWSKPTNVRTVSFANLAPGGYRFLVKAVAFGQADPPPATFTFTIVPPVWRRWWFVTLAVLTVSAMVYSAYRFRLEQLLRVERVRNRIATDLHDDIGSALSQISLLSEVAHRQQGSAERSASLERIATVARETTQSISDIVWAINPRRDSLSDLSVRIRGFAAELCSARDIECNMDVPDSSDAIPLDIDTRRQLLLIAKEAIHNLVRHSRCTRAGIELKREGRFLILRVEDNGVGFDACNGHHGHGLNSMRERAASLGGKMTVHSQPGRTCMEFHVPL